MSKTNTYATHMVHAITIVCFTLHLHQSATQNNNYTEENLQLTSTERIATLTMVVQQAT